MDTAGKKITFTYNDVLGRDIYGPPENGSNATHFYLVFYFAGKVYNLLNA